MESNFGEFLKRKRQEKNITQKDLAKLLFVSDSTVSKWENNVAHPDITLLPKLSEILNVSEHELITASTDDFSRREKAQAKKWRTLSFSWNLFFYIAYGVALITCFICNLAVNKTLSWFWIVFCALLFSFTLTNLPELIKKHKLVLIPSAALSALILLLGVCCIYVNGTWFWIAALSVLLGFTIVFCPIYVSKCRVFSRIKKYNDFVSVAVDFIVLNILLVAVNLYTLSQGSASVFWYITVALPIAFTVYVILNILLCVRFLKVNGLIKTSAILFFISFLYTLTPLIKVGDPAVQKEIDDLNVFKANFSSWQPEVSLDNNVNCIIFFTLLFLSVVFLTAGIIKTVNKKRNADKK